MPLTMFGLKGCDTVKKARTWLDAKGIAYVFHDYKKEGADPVRLEKWVAGAGWEKLLNRAGTTFRKLPDTDKADIDAGKAITLMQAHPSTIKRPVVEHPGGLLIGFREADWETALMDAGA